MWCENGICRGCGSGCGLRLCVLAKLRGFRSNNHQQLLSSRPFLLLAVAHLAMLQKHALRPFRCAAGRSRLSVASKQVSLLRYRDLATAATAPSPNDPFANGTNTYYAEEMYRHWRQDPTSVHASWDAYFSGLEKGLGSNAFQSPPKFLPAPADGAPALYASGGAQLDDHLKVRAPAHYVG
jgi:hypothetical protein